MYLCRVGTELGFILGGHQLTKGTDCKCALHSVRLGLNSGPCLAWTSPLCNSTNDGTFRYPIISGKTALPGPAAKHLTNGWRQSFQPYSPGVIPKAQVCYVLPQTLCLFLLMSQAGGISTCQHLQMHRQLQTCPVLSRCLLFTGAKVGGHGFPAEHQNILVSAIIGFTVQWEGTRAATQTHRNPHITNF